MCVCVLLNRHTIPKTQANIFKRHFLSKNINVSSFCPHCQSLMEKMWDTPSLSSRKLDGLSQQALVNVRIILDINLRLHHTSKTCLVFIFFSQKHECFSVFCCRYLFFMRNVNFTEFAFEQARWIFTTCISK